MTTDLAHLGPLATLAGTWEGDQGLDVAFQHARGDIGETPYRERITFNPFGPVDNGTQCLYGLDYRTALQLMVAGFFQSVVTDITIEGFAEELAEIVATKLATSELRAESQAR